MKPHFEKQSFTSKYNSGWLFASEIIDIDNVEYVGGVSRRASWHHCYDYDRNIAYSVTNILDSPNFVNFWSLNAWNKIETCARCVEDKIFYK